MDDEVIKRCFEPFFTTKSQGEGSGLGLFNVFQTVHQCGGAVAVETEQGRGTTFRLLLPAVERRERARDALAERPRKATVVQEAPAQRLAALRAQRSIQAEPSVRAEMPTPVSESDLGNQGTTLTDPPRG
jgi:Histidine kinase-, DNA gyrase B-, and HSP90-like ATPase